ncbi:MAG: endonuclease III [Anaerolineales bacterium]|nr:endonuclease III [Anaerolineales bacterium]
MTSNLAMIQSIFMTGYDQIYKALKIKFGEPDWRPHLAPVDELVSTILSQNTNDTNRDLAFENLLKRFGKDNWQAVRDAPPDQVIDAIRSAGLAQQKGPRIQNALKMATDSSGRISLDLLEEMPIDQARKWLTDLPGVGPKTAAIVLLFAFGRPAFPVDTHIHRVTKRIGLIPSNTSAEKAHHQLEQIVPPEHYYTMHLNLIRLGRNICQARTPKCEQCPLQEYCDYYAGLGKE